MTDATAPQTPEERAILRNAATARRRHLRGHVEKPAPVTAEEYAQRLKNSLRKDATLMDTVRESNITKEKAKWGERLKYASTFRQARTELPAILERVERLRNKRGLHKTSICLSGQQLGRGKTWQGYAYLNQLIEAGGATSGQVVFGTEGATTSNIATSGYERSEKMREFIRDSHKVFFIDDVGQGYYYKAETRHEIWYELINHIYTNQLTLIITTNLFFKETGKDSLGEWMGIRAFDRLKSLCGEDGHVQISGVNRREAVSRENEEKYLNKKR